MTQWTNDTGSVMRVEPTDEPFKFRVFRDDKPFKMDGKQKKVA